MSSTIEINSLLELMVNKKGSDLHLRVDKPPVIRVSGRMRELNLPKLTPEDTTNLMKSICSDRIQQQLNEVGSGDFGFAYRDKARFRVSRL
jgi:twitching motility protein PilT